MNKTILVIDDDIKISKLIYDYFTEDGFTVVTAYNGAQGLLEMDSGRFDLIILDIMLPLLDGWEVCSKIRSFSNVPVIMLTAKSDELSNLKGYQFGADDYVTKPFSPKILLAKAKAIINRLDKNIEMQEGIYQIDEGFIINELSYNVTVDDEDVNLSSTEFSMLLYFVKNKNIVLSREKILIAVWGPNYFGDFRMIDTNIKRLREKLKSRANCICTVRGVGYKFEVK